MAKNGITQADLNKFDAALARVGKDLLPAELVKLHKEVVFMLLQGVVMKTPVDIGVARGGWQVGVNFIPRARTAADKGGQSTIRKASARLASLKPYSIVYLANNVEYIVYLEEGSSRQAPNGMVRLSLQEVTAHYSAKGF